MAQLPLVIELVVQARAQRLGTVIDEVALGITVGGMTADIDGAPGLRIARNAAVGVRL